jgi:hypothetical protein
MHYTFEVTDEAAELIADALAIVNPDSDHAENLARTLEEYFRYVRVKAPKEAK